jgi:putative tryptophan/tyrosine transport system substrate-binding protein
MRRREFIAFVSAAAVSRPFAARAQQTAKQHRIAFVHSGIPANQLTETAGPFWVKRF